MKKKRISRRWLAVGIILLFVGTCIIPAVAEKIESENQVTFFNKSPGIVWSKTYGGGNVDIAMSVTQTRDNGYIIGGYTNSYGAGDFDAWLIKTDSEGNEIWNKTYGGFLEDIVHCVIETSDGGYAVAGYAAYSGLGYCELWIFKTDENGTTMWSKKYRNGDYAFGSCIIETEHGFVVVAEGNDDIWLMGIDANGDVIWDNTFGGIEPDQGKAVIHDRNGGYCVVGTTYSFGSGSSDIWLVKTNETGVEVWNKTFGGVEFDTGADVIQVDDGGFAITGGITPTQQIWGNVCLIRTDENGSELWTKLYGGADLDYGQSIIQIEEGEYLLAGITHSYKPKGFNGWVIKTDENGSEFWNVTLGGEGDDWAESIIQSSDGGYVIAGKYNDDNGDDDASLVKIGDIPTVTITKPKKGLYFNNSLIRPFLLRKPMIIGPINVEVEVVDLKYEIEKVEFYINGELMMIKTSEPYFMIWNETVFGRCDMKVVAFNSNGYIGVASIRVWKFF